MHETFEQIFEGMGAEPLGDKPGKDEDYGLHAPRQDHP